MTAVTSASSSARARTTVPQRRRRRLRRDEVIGWGVILAVVVVAMVPLLWIMRIALMPRSDYTRNPSGLEGGFTLENFTHSWSFAGLGDALVNSLTVVPLGAAGATAFAALGGFALAKLYVPFRRVFETLLVLSIAVPLTSIALPLFDQGLTLGYVDNRPALSLVYASVFASWGTLYLRAFFRSIPESLLESARLDGCRTFAIFWRIAVPLAVPALATVFVLNVYIQWSDLLLALVLLPDPASRTLTVSIATLSTETVAPASTLAAAAILAAAPVIALFLATRRLFKNDLMLGGVK